MTTNPRTGYAQPIKHAFQLGHLAANAPDASYGQVQYWSRFLTGSEKIGGFHYYTESHVLAIRITSVLVKHLKVSARAAVKLGVDMAKKGTESNGRIWIELKDGTQLGVPVPVYDLPEGTP